MAVRRLSPPLWFLLGELAYCVARDVVPYVVGRALGCRRRLL